MGNGERAAVNVIGQRIRRLLHDWSEMPSVKSDPDAMEYLRRAVAAVTAFEQHIRACGIESTKERDNGAN